MFNTDKPIDHMDQDLLGRSKFAVQLASAIMQFKTKHNYAISLQGKWGCGKTSVLNMTIKEIEKQASANEFVVVQFNPWNLTDTNQLINQFFTALTNSLKFNVKDEKFKKIGTAIKGYSSVLQCSESIPIVGKFSKPLYKILGMLGKSITDQAISNLNDISYQKIQVEKALIESDFKILVVIDDIDRLSNEQIKLIFQLVNAVAGFPNIIYLLSFDKNIVVRALSEVQHCDGEEYLEKIIQIAFDIPPLNTQKLHTILLERLKTMVELPVGDEFYHVKRWTNVSDSCIHPYINTLRDVNKYCNTLSFMYSAVKEEVDFIDMAGICALKMFAFPIFEWIRENKLSLTADYNNILTISNQNCTQKEEPLKQFKEAFPDSTQSMLNALSSLFPNFSRQHSSYSHYKTSSELHQAMRIASANKFDLYFYLSLNSIKISRPELYISLLSMEESELRQYLDSLNEKGLFNEYIGELKHHLLNISPDRIELFLSVLIFKSGRIAEKNAQLIGVDKEKFDFYTVFNLLFKVENEDRRFDLIANMFSNSDSSSFQVLSQLLHYIELTYGHIFETEYINCPKPVSEKNLQILEQIFLERIKGFSRTENLFEWTELQIPFLIWEYIEKDTYSEYIKSEIQNELNAIKLVVLDINKNQCTENIYKYEYRKNSYTEYIGTSSVVEIIEKMRMKKEFWNLNEITIELAVALFLSITSDSPDKLINFQLVNEKNRVWKSEFLEYIST